MRIEVGQIISQILSFLILLWVLRRYAWQPILKILDDRSEAIKSEFDVIEEQKNQTAQMAEEYRKKLAGIEEAAHAKQLEAIEKGRQAALEIQNTAHETAKEMIEKAQKDSIQELQKAKELLKNEIVKMALEATEKMLQTNISQEQQESLIVDFVKRTEAR